MYDWYRFIIDLAPKRIRERFVIVRVIAADKDACATPLFTVIYVIDKRDVETDKRIVVGIWRRRR